MDGRSVYALGGNVGNKRVVRDKMNVGDKHVVAGKLRRYEGERTTFGCDVREREPL